MVILGQTQDDAVGEAFDKSAKLLGLPYPGGPMIDKLAKDGDPFGQVSVQSRSEMPDLDYSFSGIKTSILYFLRKEVAKNMRISLLKIMNDLAASIQSSLIEMLMIKTKSCGKAGAN